MNFLELFFKDAIKSKQNYIIQPVQLQTKRAMKTTNPQEIEISKKEEELLNKIRMGIEESRTKRKDANTSMTTLVKLTKEGVMKLEEKIYTEQAKSLHTIEKDTSKDFYKQYSTGQFVVSL